LPLDTYLSIFWDGATKEFAESEMTLRMKNPIWHLNFEAKGETLFVSSHKWEDNV
jgi:hypothetical protein